MEDSALARMRASLYATPQVGLCSRQCHCSSHKRSKAACAIGLCFTCLTCYHACCKGVPVWETCQEDPVKTTGAAFARLASPFTQVILADPVCFRVFCRHPFITQSGYQGVARFHWQPDGLPFCSQHVCIPGAPTLCDLPHVTCFRTLIRDCCNKAQKP